MDTLKQRNDLMVCAAFARTLVQVAARLDPTVCDEAALLELLALADRAEEALGALESP